MYTETMAAHRTHKLIDAGSRAPGFRLARLSGGEVTLRELVANGPVLLAFFKISCPICQLAFPFLERIHQAGTLPIYGISQNDPADTRDFNQQFGVTFPTLLDSEDGGFPASNDYGISSVPTMFLVAPAEPGGLVSRVFEGWNKKEMAWLGAKAGVNPFRQGDNVPEWKAG
jgi:peroxiredoxin